jgi:hypothetical protein
MRTSNHRGWRGTTLLIVAVLGTAACGSVVPSSAPAVTARPTPVITPDPHLTEPATADAVFNAIGSGELPLVANNATVGGPGSPVVKRINADIGNWPLIISQYQSSDLLRSTIKWKPAAKPNQGNAPYTFVGLNIVIEFGPTTGKLAAPDATRQDQAERLIALIDPLLWPLEQRSVAPLTTKTPPPHVEPSAAPPKKSPKP